MDQGRARGLVTLRRFALGAAAVLLAFAAEFSWLQWRDLTERKLRNMETLAELSGQSMETYLAGVEAAMAMVAETMLDGAGEVDEARAAEGLRRLKRAYPELRITVVVGADGRFLASSEPRPQGGLPPLSPSVFGRIVEESSQTKGLRIGRAFFGPITGEWVMPLGYSVYDGKGALRHVLGAGLPVARSQALWKDAPVEPGAAFALVRDDGYVVSRYPLPPDADLTTLYGKPLSGPSFARFQSTERERGNYRARSSVTGDDVLVALKRLKRNQVTMSVVNPVSNVRAEWLDSVWLLWLLVGSALLLVGGAYAWARRRQLEWDAERERRLQELESANRELESFNYTVSHDLRAPLRAISAFSTLLTRNYAGRLDAEAGRLLGRINAAAQRMGEQIDHLLQLARIYRQEIAREEVDLGMVARELVSELQAGNPDREVEVLISSGLNVRGDPRLLRSVLQNLIGNAWKFTWRRRPGRIDVGMVEQDGERCFFVRDNGEGFDMQFADKLFKAFERLHADEDVPGSGIGLAIVERIVIRHGGRVWAEAAPQRGATFYFTLPDAGEK